MEARGRGPEAIFEQQLGVPDMDIILINHKKGQTRRLQFSLRRVKLWLPPLMGFFLVLSGAFFGGYALSPQTDRGVEYVMDVTRMWDRELTEQRRDIAQTRQSIDDNMRAMAIRLGELQAHMMRINAVGQRMTEMAQLDSEEFDFGNAPALGGPEDADEVQGREQSIGELMASLEQFSSKLNATERKMRVLEDLMVADRLRDEVLPSGRPVRGGWLTSGYGWRTDPFSGSSMLHKGIDFATRAGSEVHVVGSGVVSFSGWRRGYGNLVEIDHGNGYLTRYGHNQKNLVRAGQRVKKGEAVAKVGSTGRSTGPHVHFEVLRNGKQVNPAEYVQAAR